MKLEHVNKIAIVGTGMIGASLATLFTGHGYATTMLALNDREAAGGLERYRTNFADLIAEGLVTAAQADACERLLSITQTYDDLADAEAAELEVLRDYLPKALSSEELEAVVTRAVEPLLDGGMKMMGKAIQAIMTEYKGRVDGKAVSDAVKARFQAAGH